MAIKLIALDLDGTTLNSKGKLSERNKNALAKAIEKGVVVVIATGRCFSALPEEVTKLPQMQYVITSNGAQIRDLRTKEAVYNNCIAAAAVTAAEKILRECSHMIEIFIDGKAYIEKALYESIRDGGLTYRHRDYVLNTRNPVENLMEFMLQHRAEIENINIFFETQKARAEMRPLLETLKNVTLTTSLDNNWEIGGEDTSKANALHTLCKMLDIQKEEVMACGDSPNDKDMLREAGIAVAVGNAKPVIKETADYISGTNDEDGVAQAVEKFVLTKE